MVLLRRVIGDALRARRQGQHRTLREVSTVANVSLGYLSEIERGQKEASSELLAAICDALGAQLSDVLRQVSDTLAIAEEMEEVLAPVGGPADSGDSAKGDHRDSAMDGGRGSAAGDGRDSAGSRDSTTAGSRDGATDGARVGAARSDRVADASRNRPVGRPAERVPAAPAPAERIPATAGERARAGRVPTDRVAVPAIRLPQPMKRAGIGPSQRSQPVRPVGGDGEVTVSVRHDTPLMTTLKTARPRPADDREREIVYV